EELHVDYTKPLNIGHKKDASRIADSSGELLKKLTELFKEFGIDCRAAPGSKVIEPEYYIEIKKEQIKDTVYTRAMCEEPRNKYNCQDVLTTKCKRRGAVGELKYIVRMTWYHAVGGLGFYGRTKLGYEYDFYLSRDGEIDLSPFFPEIKRIASGSRRISHYYLFFKEACLFLSSTTMRVVWSGLMNGMRYAG
ncbi:MAG: hypothetical protein EBY20_12090, partial [Alphaproteobacteria bacterium]|nr:hypothetical protein [Alphaproteobacteria bacterium]